MNEWKHYTRSEVISPTEVLICLPTFHHERLPTKKLNYLYTLCLNSTLNSLLCSFYNIHSHQSIQIHYQVTETNTLPPKHLSTRSISLLRAQYLFAFLFFPFEVRLHSVKCTSLKCASRWVLINGSQSSIKTQTSTLTPTSSLKSLLSHASSPEATIILFFFSTID